MRTKNATKAASQHQKSDPKKISSIILNGCRSIPLAHYLKSLGILRLVSEQLDPSCRGAWRAGTFTLETSVTKEVLVDFFLHQYQPTPLVSPWNGGSGFYPKDSDAAIKAIESSLAERWSSYREVIALARNIVSDLGLTKKPEKVEKVKILELCRGRLPDREVEWLDATYLLVEDGAKYPYLLGTGANDGRLEFVNNFMQRLLALFSPESGSPTPDSEKWLLHALFGDVIPGLQSKAAIGQFFPGSAGGMNASSGFESNSLINPWDYVLLLEGALMFAVAASKRWSSSAKAGLSYPFTVYQSGVGYGSATAADESSENARAEMWLPLWSHPASQREISHIFGEGRAQIGTRHARNGLDFARAITGLGIDRGIESFQRFGLQKRNGLAYFAVPLGLFQVRSNPNHALLNELDGWMDWLRSKPKSNAPASIFVALKRLEQAIWEFCERCDQSLLLPILQALGACEKLVARRTKWAIDSFVPPIPFLSANWIEPLLEYSTPELRLAISLASTLQPFKDEKKQLRWLPFRACLSPIWSFQSKTRWKDERKHQVTWKEGNEERFLQEWMMQHLRNVTLVGKKEQDRRESGAYPASLHDINEVIEGRINWKLFASNLWACSLIDWQTAKNIPKASSFQTGEPGTSSLPDAFYALSKLCFPIQANWRSSLEVPHHAHIYRLCTLQDPERAGDAILTRLRANGEKPAIKKLAPFTHKMEAISAALCFPISFREFERLRDYFLRTKATNETDATEPKTESSDAQEPKQTVGVSS